MEAYSRKVTKGDGRLLLEVPEEIAEFLTVEQGDAVSFQIVDNQVVVRPERKLDTSELKGLDEDFAEGVRVVLDKYDQTFRTLADRRDG